MHTRIDTLVRPEVPAAFPKSVYLYGKYRPNGHAGRRHAEIQIEYDRDFLNRYSAVPAEEQSRMIDALNGFIGTFNDVQGDRHRKWLIKASPSLIRTDLIGKWCTYADKKFRIVWSREGADGERYIFVHCVCRPAQLHRSRH